MGFNYRFTDVKASIGISQLSKLDFILEKRQKVVQKLKYLMGSNIKFQKVPSYVDLHPYYNLTCLFDDKETRDLVQKKWESNQIETRISFPPAMITISSKSSKVTVSKLPNTILSYETMLDIPCHQNITDNEIDKISNIILNNV